MSNKILVKNYSKQNQSNNYSNRIILIGNDVTEYYSLKKLYSIVIIHAYHFLYESSYSIILYHYLHSNPLIKLFDPLNKNPILILKYSQLSRVFWISILIDNTDQIFRVLGEFKKKTIHNNSIVIYTSLPLIILFVEPSTQYSSVSLISFVR